jgi:hypothetical protein
LSDNFYGSDLVHSTLVANRPLERPRRSTSLRAFLTSKT